VRRVVSALQAMPDGLRVVLGEGAGQREGGMDATSGRMEVLGRPSRWSQVLNAIQAALEADPHRPNPVQLVREEEIPPAGT